MEVFRYLPSRSLTIWPASRTPGRLWVSGTLWRELILFGLAEHAVKGGGRGRQPLAAELFTLVR